MVSYFKKINNCDLIGFYHNKKNKELNNLFKVDMAEYGKVNKLLNKIQPHIIIHCAAITNVDYCETNKHKAEEINCLAVKNIASNIKERTKLVFISSDCLFNGENGNYSERSRLEPKNTYARTKQMAEMYIKQYCKNFLILRTNFFGRNKVYGESFAEWIENSLKNNKKIRMFTDVLFTPLYSTTLCKYILKLIKLEERGTFHLSSCDAISKYDFGMFLAKTFGLDHTLISPCSVDDFNFKAIRPKKMSLNTKKVSSVLGGMPFVRTEILRFFKQSI